MGNIHLRHHKARANFLRSNFLRWILIATGTLLKKSRSNARFIAFILIVRYYFSKEEIMDIIVNTYRIAPWISEVFVVNEKYDI